MIAARPPHTLKSFMLASSVLAGAAGGAAHAQTGADEDNVTYLETIVVTVSAQKREQEFSDVPISITALSDVTLQNTRARSLEQLEQLAPNFDFLGGGTFPNLSIRGIGGGGRNVGFTTRAGAYLDGVYIGQPSALTQPLQDIERVEVLRGPQGYLYGRNTVSGAVNIITASPDEVATGSLQLAGGADALFEALGSLRGPIMGDQLFGSIAFGYERRDGFVDNRFGGDDLDDLERQSVRGKVRWDATDDLSITLAADFGQTDTTNIVGETQQAILPGVFPPGILPFESLPSRTVNFNVTPENNAQLWGVSATVEYDLPRDFQIRSITAYRETEQERVNDLDYSPVDLASFDYLDEFQQISQELQILSPDDTRARYLGGIYYYDETADTTRRINIGSDVNTQLVPNPLNPTQLVPFSAVFGVPAGGAVPSNGTVDTRTIAGFASLDYDVTNRVTVNLGGRFTSEERELTYNLDGSQSGQFQIATLSNFTDEISDEEFTWTAGLTVGVTDTINAFGKAATGFKAGGFNTDFVNQAQVLAGLDFATETSISYEGGFKGTTLNERVRFDIVGFFTQFDDFQIDVFRELAPGLTVPLLTNAAEVETVGFEASADAIIARGLSVGASFGYAEATFEDFVSDVEDPQTGQIVQEDFSGNDLPDAPQFSGVFFANYLVPVASLGGNFELYGEYSYRDEAVSNAENTLEIDERNLFNARVSFSPFNEYWRLSLWGRNLFDEEFVESRDQDFFQNETIRLGDPLTWGGDVTVRF